MNASVWGPKVWDVLFATAFRMPAKETTVVLWELRHVLPCSHCKRSYRAYVETQMDPRACIQTADDAAKFVWALHDLVNVKLDKKKACIPFSILEARHAVFESYVSAWCPLDVLALMSLQLEEPAEAEAYAAIAPVLCALATKLGAPPSVAVAVSEAHRSPVTAWLHAMACKNAMRAACGLSQLSRAQFRAPYELCRASSNSDDAASEPKPSRGLKRALPSATSSTSATSATSATSTAARPSSARSTRSRRSHRASAQPSRH